VGQEAIFLPNQEEAVGQTVDQFGDAKEVDQASQLVEADKEVGQASRLVEVDDCGSDVKGAVGRGTATCAC
jgi:hypothetical protein